MSMLIPNLEELVAPDHEYQQILKLIDFSKLCYTLRLEYSTIGRAGYPVEQGFKCLLLQFMEDLSDRQLERCLKENLAAKLFCGFTLVEPTPDHSYFGSLRKRIGVKHLEKLFTKVIKGLKDSGLVSEVFSFVDASALHARVDVWRARDKAIEDARNDQEDDDGNPTMNNKNISRYTSDPDARFGAKGKKRIWLGYKRHVCVDMKQGFITKTKVRPANEPDHKGLQDVCPEGGMVCADKAYCSDEAKEMLRKNDCYPGVIHKKNMKEKNRERERWLSALRMPYEGVFAGLSNRARYRGSTKCQFQALMQALAFNFKRLIKVATMPIEFVPA